MVVRKVFLQEHGIESFRGCEFHDMQRLVWPKCEDKTIRRPCCRSLIYLEKEFVSKVADFQDLENENDRTIILDDLKEIKYLADSLEEIANGRVLMNCDKQPRGPRSVMIFTRQGELDSLLNLNLELLRFTRH